MQYTNDIDICAHYGEEEERFHGAAVPPIFQTSLFDFDGSDYVYTRSANPTIEIAERKLAALERGAAARCFSSGMAAISSAILSSVSAGAEIAAMRSIYSLTRDLLQEYLPRFDVTTRFVSGDDLSELESLFGEKTRVIYLESPSTFTFRLVDVRRIAELAHARDITVILDNSWATPLYQKPLELGVDLVVHSASKYLAGHSDIVAGAVVGPADRLHRIAAEERTLLGGSMDPHQAFLLTRGLRTLPMRMDRHRATALAIARRLQRHRAVKEVLHPALASGEQHTLAERQLTGTSGLFSVVLDTDLRGLRRFADSLRVFRHAPSWGGFESLVSIPGLRHDPEYLEAADIPPTLARISAGLESEELLIEDLERCLNGVVAG